MNVLIAPKPFSAYSPEEYHAYVTVMYGLRTKARSTKPASPVQGISITKTKKGTLGVRRMEKGRPFAYVTYPEIAALAKHHGVPQSDLWNAFKAKDYIVTKTRMEAEKLYAEIQGIPW